MQSSSCQERGVRGMGRTAWCAPGQEAMKPPGEMKGKDFCLQIVL